MQNYQGSMNTNPYMYLMYPVLNNGVYQNYENMNEMQMYQYQQMYGYPGLVGGINSEGKIVEGDQINNSLYGQQQCIKPLLRHKPIFS